MLRGKWVLDRILGQPPSPPPPDVPALEPDIRGATTIRQQLDKHRNTPACASCHVTSTRPASRWRSFDVIGGWRDFYRGHRAAAKLGRSGQLPGPQDLPRSRRREGRQDARRPSRSRTSTITSGLLLADKDQLARNLARKLLIYATGADIQFADREVVEDLVAKCRARNYGFRSLVHEVVQSRVFLNK